MNTDPVLLAAAVAEHLWFHSIDLGGGVVTRGDKSADILARERQSILDGVDLEGRSVLDIGAWNGFFSFEAKRAGAARVLATDSFVWTHPMYRGRETFELARRALGLDIEALEVDAMDLDPERLGTFDVVLFLGVFYHLEDPILGLRRAASMAGELLIVETATALEEMPFPAMRHYPGRELNDDPTNWWAPNPRCMVDLLGALGFQTVDAAWHPDGEHRAIFHAWRSTAARKAGPPPRLRLDVSRPRSPWMALVAQIPLVRTLLRAQRRVRWLVARRG